MLGDQLGDPGLFGLVLDLAGRVFLVFDAGSEGGTTVETAQQVFFGQGIDVTADGLRRDIEQTGEFLDRHEPAGPYQLQDLFMTRQAIHLAGILCCVWITCF